MRTRGTTCRGARGLGNAPILESHFPTNERLASAPRPRFWAFWKMMRPCAFEGRPGAVWGFGRRGGCADLGLGFAPEWELGNGGRRHVTGGNEVGVRVDGGLTPDHPMRCGCTLGAWTRGVYICMGEVHVNLSCGDLLIFVDSSALSRFSSTCRLC